MHDSLAGKLVGSLVGVETRLSIDALSGSEEPSRLERVTEGKVGQGSQNDGEDSLDDEDPPRASPECLVIERRSERGDH